jgi:hypothetical protein
MLPEKDPVYGLENIEEEMIARGPYIGIHYKEDNNEVQQMICHIMHGGPGWSWVKGFQRTSNVWQAYLAIKARSFWHLGI